MSERQAERRKLAARQKQPKVDILMLKGVARGENEYEYGKVYSVSEKTAKNLVDKGAACRVVDSLSRNLAQYRVDGVIVNADTDNQLVKALKDIGIKVIEAKEETDG